MAGIIASAVVPHTPRMGAVDGAPDFIQPLIDGARQMGTSLRALTPDLFVLNSAHWVSTFNWYATCQDVHEGFCVADEAPDMIPGTAYRRQGDAAFAETLIALAGERGLPCLANRTGHFQWDYGSLVPLLYLDPDSTVPVVLVPTVLSAGLDESMAMGRLIHEAGVQSGKRVIHLSSTALSHKLVRGPAQWATEERQAMDRRFAAMACAGDLAGMIEYLPEFVREGVVEMGGRVIASFLGSLAALGDVRLSGREYGAYAQSSGSGNLSVAMMPAA